MTAPHSKSISPGKWFADFDENGNATETYYDESFRNLLGFTAEEFANDQESWANNVHPEDRERVDAYFADIMSYHPEGKDYDIEYRIMTKWGYHWFHDYARITRREDGSVLHFEGVSFDIQEIKEYETQQAHDNLKKEVLDYIVNHDDEDPIELLGRFTEKVRDLIDCDQVIYRDLEQTRIMVNSPAIENTWAVPFEYCQQCEHLDPHHPMYAKGYTLMDNCQEGWQGIPVYHKCPIKSSMTRLVYCNGEVAGYLAIHFIQKYHHFTEVEQKTLEEFCSNFSLLLSRYESNKAIAAIHQREEKQTQLLIQNNQRVMALEDNFESLYEVELDSGQYIGYVKGEFYQRNVIDKLLNPGDYFEDLRANIDAVIYPEDRDDLYNVLNREAIRKALSESDRFEHYYRILVDSKPVWFKIRVVYKDIDKKSVIIGVFNASEELEAKQIAEQRAQIEEDQRRLREDMEMISGLANEYHALYYVNVKEGFFKVYSIDEKKFPEAKHMVAGGGDPSDVFRMFGASPLVHPDDKYKFLDLKPETIMKNLAHSKKFTTRYRRKFGDEYLWTEMEFIKYEDIDTPANIIAVGFAERDAEIRKEQKQREELEEAYKMAQTASEAKSNFLFNMSHDIRTPMNAITGFTTMAKKYADEPEKVVDYLNKIDLAGQQLLLLINQVLEMSRIESGKVEFDEHPVNIKERFDAMVTILAEQAEVRGLAFNSSMQDIKHFNVFADDARMGQITLNIAGNAMKYTPEGGRIDFIVKEIPARKEGYGSYVFTVADTGIGMSEDYLKTIYEPFTREKTTTVSKIQGTGLGMSIVKSLVDLAGGKIDVKSEPGKGTRFDVTIDFRLNDQAPEIEVPTKDASSIDLNGRRVLLVEDNELNREIAKFILEDKGMLVEEADDGDVAVERMSDIAAEGNFSYFDFILMDVQMPRMNGYEATARIRELLDPLCFHIPIIALSANAFEEDRKKSHAAGMDDHVAKPIDVTELCEAMAKFL